MDNVTEGGISLNSHVFMVYSVVLVVVAAAAGLLIGFNIFALLMATSVPRPVRFFLVNLLLAGLLVAAVEVFVGITSAVLVPVGAHHPAPPYLCRVYLWLFASGVTARLWNLAAFALSVLAIVRFSKKTITPGLTAIIISTLWLVPLTMTLYVLLPYVYEVQFVHGVACFPDNNRTIIIQARHTFLSIWIIFGGLTPVTVSIVVPIYCLCYIRKNIVTEGTQYRKGMAKFSLFLMVGGAINILGQVLPGLLTYYSTATGVYLSYGSAAVSLLPTPIIILAYLKPVRDRLQALFTCGRKIKREAVSRAAASTEGTIVTEADV